MSKSTEAHCRLGIMAESREDSSARRCNGLMATGVGRRRWRWLVVIVSVVPITACNLWDSLSGRPNDDNKRIVWSVAGRRNRAQPVVDQGSAYFLGNAHQLTAVDKVSGQVRWDIVLPVDVPSTVGLGGVISNGRLIIGDQDLFAIDSRTGEINWRAAPANVRNPGRAIPALWADLVVGGSSSGHVYAVEQATGNPRWTTRLVPGDSTTVYRPTVVGDAILVTFTDFTVAPNDEPQGGVAAVAASTGAIKWLRMLPHNVDNNGPTATLEPAVAGSVVAAAARDGPVYGLDLETGEIRWKAPALPTPGASSAAMIRDLRPLTSNSTSIFVGSSAQLVIALDPATGVELWRMPTPLGSHGTFLWCDERSVYVFYPGGQLEVLDAATGKRRWALTDGNFLVGPAIDGDRLYVGGTRGLYALRNN